VCHLNRCCFWQKWQKFMCFYHQIQEKFLLVGDRFIKTSIVTIDRKKSYHCIHRMGCMNCITNELRRNKKNVLPGRIELPTFC
jgi:hypothetical protein